MLFLLQSNSGPSPECVSDPKCVYLDPPQLVEIVTQMQGAAYFVAAWLAGCVFCLGTLVLLRAVSGR